MLFYFSMFCRLTLQRNTENHEPANNSSKFALRCCDNYGFTATRWGRGAEFCRKKGFKYHKNARTTDYFEPRKARTTDYFEPRKARKGTKESLMTVQTSSPSKIRGGQGALTFFDHG